MEKKTKATPVQIYEAVKDVGNLKKLKGRILCNPFVKGLCEEPVSLNRLDAKFLAN